MLYDNLTHNRGKTERAMHFRSEIRAYTLPDGGQRQASAVQLEPDQHSPKPAAR